jgi:hypothetical protein
MAATAVGGGLVPQDQPTGCWCCGEDTEGWKALMRSLVAMTAHTFTTRPPSRTFCANASIHKHR